MHSLSSLVSLLISHHDDLISDMVIIMISISFLGREDAIAELIDNSLQACEDQPSSQRRIQLSFVTKWIKSDGKDLVNGYVIMLDTGKGMSDKDCERFATYGEKKAVSEHGISKYGVGAKHAAFYLGESVHVLSKEKNKNKMTYFSLDVVSLKLNAYHCKFKDYDTSTSLQDIIGRELANKCDAANHISRHIDENREEMSSFCILIIPVRNGLELLNDLITKEVYDQMLERFHEIYYFHFNNIPNQSQSLDGIRPPLEGINLEVQVFRDGKPDGPAVNIKEVRSFTKRCMEKIETNPSMIFPFQLSIDDPHDTKNEFHRYPHKVHRFKSILSYQVVYF